jgi:hypothetical protein
MIGCFAESKDAGANWTLHFGTPSFEAQARVYFLDKSSNWLVPSKGSLWRTTDSGGSWTNVANLAAGGHSAGNIYRSRQTGFYIGTMQGLIHSSDGVAWELIPSSGQWVKTILGDGDSMFGATGSLPGVLSSPEKDGNTWTMMSGSPGGADGCFATTDVGHHVLYVSCQAPSPVTGRPIERRRVAERRPSSCGLLGGAVGEPLRRLPDSEELLSQQVVQLVLRRGATLSLSHEDARA